MGLTNEDFEDLQMQVLTVMSCIAIITKAMIKANKQTDLITIKQQEFLLDSLFIFDKYMQALRERNKKS